MFAFVVVLGGVVGWAATMLFFQGTTGVYAGIAIWALFLMIWAHRLDS